MVSFILKNFVKNVLTLLVQFAIPVLFMNIMLSYVEYGSILYYLTVAIGVDPMAICVRRMVG